MADNGHVIDMCHCSLPACLGPKCHIQPTTFCVPHRPAIQVRIWPGISVKWVGISANGLGLPWIESGLARIAWD
jgi:hypothetical protein